MSKKIKLVSILFIAILGITLTVIFVTRPRTFSVKFHTDGGTNIETIKVKKGNIINEPTPPSKIGYVFDGWWKESTFSRRWTFSLDKVESDITLYAKWNPKLVTTVSVVFDTDGGQPYPATITINQGQKILKPTDPTKLGYTFSGWYVDNTLFDFNQIITTNITLRAKWEIVPIEKVTVTFDIAGGVGELDSQIINKNSQVIKPENNPTRAGYTFIGWHLDNQLYAFSAPVTKNITLVAKWQEDVPETVKYNITFKDGTTVLDVIEIYENGVLESKELKDKDEAKFIGWKIEGNDNNEVFEFNTQIQSDLVLVAIWQSRYLVEFEIEDGETTTSLRVLDGEHVIEPQEPQKEGYNFIGWYLDANQFDFDKPITENVKLKAKWEEKTEVPVTYEVTFDLDNGSTNNSVMVERGKTVNAPFDPSKPGYRFIEWQYNGTKYNFNQRILSDITLTAKYVKVFTLSFEGDGLVSSVPSGLHENGTEVLFTLTTPNRKQLKSFKVNDMEKKSEVINNKFILILAEDSTVSVEWINIYEVKIDFKDGTTIKSADVLHGTTVEKPENPTREDYEFLEWRAIGNNEYDFSVAVTSDITISAVWAKVARTPEALNNFLGDQTVEAIVIPKDVPFELKEPLVLSRPVTISGGELKYQPAQARRMLFSFARASYTKVLEITTDGVKLKDVTIEGADYAIVIDGAKEINLSNVTVKSTNMGGIYVNSSEVLISKLVSENNKTAMYITESPNTAVEIVDVLEHDLDKKAVISVEGNNSHYISTRLLNDSYNKKTRYTEYFSGSVEQTKQYQDVDGEKAILKIAFTTEPYYNDIKLSKLEFTKEVKQTILNKILPQNLQSIDLSKVNFTYTHENRELSIILEDGLLDSEMLELIDKDINGIYRIKVTTELPFKTATNHEITGSELTFRIKFWVTHNDETGPKYNEEVKTLFQNEEQWKEDRKNDPVPVLAKVRNENELRDALSKSNIKIIHVLNNIELSPEVYQSTKAGLLISRSVKINGNGHKLSLEEITNWNGSYVLHVYNAKEVELTDLEISGGNVGLLVNGSEVTIDGLRISNNKFGGIEVSKGKKTPNSPKLTVKGEVTFDVETLPVIWIDKISNIGENLVEGVELKTVKPYGKDQLWYVAEQYPFLMTIDENIKAGFEYEYTPEYKYNYEDKKEITGNEYELTYDLTKLYNKGLRNDIARYLGALYRVEKSSVREIKFNGKTYLWNENGTLKGSNWENETTLVNDLGIYLLANPNQRVYEFELTDGTEVRTVKFNIQILGRTKEGFLDKISESLKGITEATVTLKDENIEVVFSEGVEVSQVEEAARKLVEALKVYAGKNSTLTLNNKTFRLETVDVIELAKTILNGTSATNFLLKGETIEVGYSASIDYLGTTFDLTGNLIFKVEGTKEGFLEKLSESLKGITEAKVTLKDKDIEVVFSEGVEVSQVEEAARKLVEALKVYAGKNSTLTLNNKTFRLETVDVIELAKTILNGTSATNFLLKGETIEVGYSASIDYLGTTFDLTGNLIFKVEGTKEGFLEKLSESLKGITEAKVTLKDKDIEVVFSEGVEVSQVEEAARNLVEALKVYAGKNSTLTLNNKTFRLETVDVIELAKTILNGTSATNFLLKGEIIEVAYSASIDYLGTTIDLNGNLIFKVEGTKEGFLDKLSESLKGITEATVTLKDENIEVVFSEGVEVSQVEEAARKLVEALKVYAGKNSTLTLNNKTFRLETVDVIDLAKTILNGTSATNFLLKGETIKVGYSASIDYLGTTIDLNGNLIFKVEGTKEGFLDKLSESLKGITEATVTLKDENIEVVFSEGVEVSQVEEAARKLVEALKVYAGKNSTLTLNNKTFRLETVDVIDLAKTILNGTSATNFLLKGETIKVGYSASIDYLGTTIDLNGNLIFKVEGTKEGFLDKLSESLKGITEATVTLKDENIEVVFSEGVEVSQVEEAARNLVEALKGYAGKNSTLTLNNKTFRLETVDVIELAKAILNGTSAANFLLTGETIEVGYNSAIDYLGIQINLNGKIEFKITPLALKEFSIIYLAEGEGEILGDTHQKVLQGRASTEVKAVPKDGYYFLKWDDGNTNAIRTDINVSESKTLKAIFLIKEYTIKYVNYDGTTLLEIKVEHGKTPIYQGDEPRREKTPEFSYNFLEFSPKIDFAKEDVTYVSTYQSVRNKYVVQFIADDDTIIEVQEVEYGSSALAPVPPKKEGYHFLDWDKLYDNITKEITVRALYEINNYVINYYDFDGTVLKNEIVEYLKDGIAPVVPFREGYEFLKWNKDYSEITSNIDVLAVYKEVQFVKTDRIDNTYFIDRNYTDNKIKKDLIGTVPVFFGNTDITEKFSFSYKDITGSKVTTIDLTNGGSTFIFDFDASSAEYQSFSGQLIIKYGTVTIGKNSDKYMTIEDALEQSKSYDTLYIKYNTSFSIESIAKKVYDKTEFRIKSNVKVVLPFGSTLDDIVDSTNTATTKVDRRGGYVKLTVPSNITVGVSGELIVNAQRSHASTRFMGFISSNNYSEIYLEDKSKVNVLNKGSLNVIGFIYGKGVINAESGSKVTEPMIIQSFRGGTATSKINSKVFPFDQFTAPNIESTMNVKYGAEYYFSAMINASKMNFFSSVKVIGTGTDAMLKISKGFIEKNYNASNGKITLSLYGTSEIRDIKVRVGLLATASSEGKYIPFDGKWVFEIKNDSKLDLISKVALLPGAKMIVENGGTLNITERGELTVFNPYEYIVETGNQYTLYGDSNLYSLYRIAPKFDFKYDTPAKLDVKGEVNVYGGIAGKIERDISGVVNINQGARTEYIIKYVVGSAAKATVEDRTVKYWTED